MASDRVSKILKRLRVPEGKVFDQLIYCPDCLWVKYDIVTRPECSYCGNNLRVITWEELN